MPELTVSALIGFQFNSVLVAGDDGCGTGLLESVKSQLILARQLVRLFDL
jgi:hypothetical protein